MCLACEVGGKARFNSSEYGKGFEQVTRLWATESHQVCALLSGSSGVGPGSQRARMGEIHPRCFILSEESWAIFPWTTDVALLLSG